MAFFEAKQHFLHVLGQKKRESVVQPRKCFYIYYELYFDGLQRRKNHER